MTNETNKAVCGNCDGTGFLAHYAHHAAGVCFTCHGTGRVAAGAPNACEPHTLDSLRAAFRAFRADVTRYGWDANLRAVDIKDALAQVAARDAALVTKVLAALDDVRKGTAEEVARGLCELRHFRRFSGSVQRLVLAAQWVREGAPRTPWKWGKDRQEAVADGDWTFNEG